MRLLGPLCPTENTSKGSRTNGPTKQFVWVCRSFGASWLKSIECAKEMSASLAHAYATRYQAALAQRAQVHSASGAGEPPTEGASAPRMVAAAANECQSQTSGEQSMRNQTATWTCGDGAASSCRTHVSIPTSASGSRERAFGGSLSRRGRRPGTGGGVCGGGARSSGRVSPPPR